MSKYVKQATLTFGVLVVGSFVYIHYLPHTTEWFVAYNGVVALVVTSLSGKK